MYEPNRRESTPCGVFVPSPLQGAIGLPRRINRQAGQMSNVFIRKNTQLTHLTAGRKLPCGGREGAEKSFFLNGKNAKSRGFFVHYGGNAESSVLGVDIRRNMVYDDAVSTKLPIYFRMNGPKVSTVTPAQVTTIGNEKRLLRC